MTKKDFFRVLIKAFGVYYAIGAVFNIFSMVIPSVLFQRGIMDTILCLFTAGIIIGFYLLLVFNPDKVISFLSLERGFDGDKVSLEGVNPETILKLSSIIIGGMLIINHLPYFLRDIYTAFQNGIASPGIAADRYLPLATNGFKIVLGFLLVSQYEWVGKLIGRNNK